MTIGRSTRGRGRAGAGGACGGRPRVSLPPSRGCGPGGRAGWAALGCLRQLPHSPWATHTTRGRPPAAPGPAASGASGDRRSGPQVGVGAGQAGRRVPAVAAAAAVQSPPGPGGRESGGPGIRSDPTPHMRTDTRVPTHAHGRARLHFYILHTTPILMCVVAVTKTAYTVTPTHWHSGTDPEAQVHIPVHTVCMATRATPTLRLTHRHIHMSHVGTVVQCLKHPAVYTGAQADPQTLCTTHMDVHTQHTLVLQTFTPNSLKVCRREGRRGWEGEAGN